MKYKIGKLVEEIAIPNSKLKYGLNDIVGVTIDKQMIPTIANLTETSLEKFNIIEPKTFIYNPRTHGKKIGLGFNDTNKTYIATWNNISFKVIDETLILPEYLFLLFNREIWDKEACFRSWGSSTVVLSWNEFCNIEVEVPNIDKQKSTISQIKAITNKIALAEKIIFTGNNFIFSQFSSYLNKNDNTTVGEWLVENPKSKIKVSDAIATGNIWCFTSGKTILRHNEPFVQGVNLFINTGGNYDAKIYFGKAAYSSDCWSIYGKDETTMFLYCLFKIHEKLFSSDEYFMGSALKHLNKNKFKEFKFFMPNNEEILNFNYKVKPFFERVDLAEKEKVQLLALKKLIIESL